MNRSATGREPVLVRLDPDDREWVDEQARLLDLNRSQVLRRIVRDARLNAAPADDAAPEAPPVTTTTATAPHRHRRTVLRPKVGARPALFGCSVAGCEWTREDR